MADESRDSWMDANTLETGDPDILFTSERKVLLTQITQVWTLPSLENNCSLTGPCACGGNIVVLVALT